MSSRWLVVTLVLGACGDNLGPPGPAPLEATWYGGVAPILARSCMGCHHDGGIAPFSMERYADVVENTLYLIDAVETGFMPPFYARETDDCAPALPWRDDPRLTTTELDLIRAWMAADYPLGEKTSIPSPPETALTGATMTLTANTPWIATGTADQFVCVILDPETTSDVWLTGLQVRPGNPLVVHHVQVDQLVNSPQTQLLVAYHGIGQPYVDDCGRPTPGTSLLHLWTPGSQPLTMNGSELAMKLGGYSKLMVQIHYHPAGRDNAPDLTAIDLRTSDVAPRKRYFPMPVGNESAPPRLRTPDFVIPAGAADHVEQIATPMDYIANLRDVRIVSVSPHMHMVGTDITTKLVRADGSSECLSNSGWDFDWQRTFTYDAPIDELALVTGADTIEVTCRYNNTTDNPSVLRMLADVGRPPVPFDVHYGPDTTDEMCLETFGLATDE